MSSVRLSQIRKSFGSNAIVKGVDLTVNEGEFLVMVGPSGCGKTTLLRLIAGLENADSGQLFMGDRDVTSVPARDRDVGMVFQSYALYPHMTVRENLGFGLSVRKTPQAEIQQRVAEVAQSLELSTLLDRKPKELSGGQRQRVAMGRVIVRRPSVFLFDEPLSNLDTALRVQMRGELARLHRRLGVTMIYVTHDQVEAMTLATRVAVFNKGILQQVGPPLELYNRPANTFVATFLGSPAMNLVSARVQSGSVSFEGLRLKLPAEITAPEVQVGLRPQDLRISAEGPLSGTVESLERLGFDGFATVKTSVGDLTARFEAGVNVDIGQRVCIAAEPTVAHVFSADGTRALCHPGSVA